VGEVTVRARFTDLVELTECVLVVPPGGKVCPGPGQPKTGVQHPGCLRIADLAVDMDAFYCPVCGRNGRISGAWAVDVIAAAR